MGLAQYEVPSEPLLLKQKHKTKTGRDCYAFGWSFEPDEGPAHPYPIADAC
jgi:hypothetical protein